MSGRELKFRVWDYITKKMYYFVEITSYKDGSVGIEFGNGFHDLRRMENGKIMQYTTILDKNGKDINEDDILEVKLNKELTVKLHVIKDNGKYVAVSHDWKYRYDLHEIRHEAEVLSNIYENPELI